MGGVVILVAARLLVAVEQMAVRHLVSTALSISPTAFAQNLATAIVASVITILLCLTSRLALAIVATGWLYALFLAVSVAKLQVLQTPFHPLDLQYLRELGLAWTSIRGDVWLAVAAWSIGGVATIAILSRRRASATLSARGRAILLLPFLLLTALGLSYRSGESRAWLYEHGVKQLEYNPMKSALRNGLLLEFVLDGFLLENRSLPEYGDEAVAQIVRRYGASEEKAPPAEPRQAGAEPVDLIVFLMEAFIDPTVLGFSTTADVVPNFRRLRERYSSGSVISPVFGGMSANAEFELLTGMSMRFLPPGASPYKRYIRHDVPSLPRHLRDHGYSTIAIHAASLDFFRYREVYPHIGFDEIETLYDRPGAPRDVSGRSASDEALVDEIIARSRGRRPYFVFAFANSTHHPWTYSGYEGSDLDIVGIRSKENRTISRTYMNALRDGDRALGRLVDYFAHRRERTAILVLGDHLPALPAAVFAELGFFDDDAPPMTQVQKRHEVQAVLWTNFALPRVDLDLSMNLLGGRVLAALGIPPTGLFSLTAAAARELPVISVFLQSADGTRAFVADELPEPQRAVLRDYEILQFDVLHGRRISMR